MQIDITAHIEKLLFLHDSLVVPGLGGFTATAAPAKADYTGGSVIPPSKILLFSENLVIDDGRLVQDIVHTHHIATEEAQKVVAEFVEQIQTLLNQREIVTLPNIGRLYKNYMQKIQFLPVANNFNAASYGLPPLQFSPIARSRQVADTTPETPAVSAPPPVAEAPQTELPTVKTPVPVIPDTEIPTPKTIEEVSETAEVTAPVVVDDAPQSTTAPSVEWVAESEVREESPVVPGLSAPPVKPVETTPPPSLAPPPVAPPAPQEIKTTSSRLFPILATLLLLAVVGGVLWRAQQLKREKEENNDLIESTKIALEGSEKASTEKEVEEQPDMTPAKPETNKPTAAVPTKPREETSTPKSVGSRECILVAATLQNEDNANALIEKLKRNGYTVYSTYKRGHQVGIKFKYQDNDDIQEKVRAIQKLTGLKPIVTKK
jgi:hypothetical protein